MTSEGWRVAQKTRVLILPWLGLKSLDLAQKFGAVGRGRRFGQPRLQRFEAPSVVANEALGLLRVQCGLRRLIGTPVVLKHETEPAKLAALAKGRLRKKKEPIVAALQGCRWPETHPFLLQQGMEHLAVLVQPIEELDHKVEDKIRAEGWQTPYQHLQTIPGIKETAASEILDEVGPKLTRWRSRVRRI